MHDWGMTEQSKRIQTWVRRILGELQVEALLALRREPRLEVMVRRDASFSVWAYFPMHRKRLIAQQHGPKAETRVLLLFGEKQFEKEAPKVSDRCLRDHLGHTLRYLRSPMAPNDCSDAQREWRSLLRRQLEW
jgi:hypothetical protein